MFSLFPPRKASLSTQGRRDTPASRAGSSRAGSVRERSLSPIRSHRRVPTANDFPVPGDYEPFVVKARDQGLVSPAASSFSFSDNEPPPVHAFTPPSPTPSLSHAISTPRDDIEKDFMMQSSPRDVSRDALQSLKLLRMHQEREAAKKKSTTPYQEAFTYEEPKPALKDQVYNASVITVEVKTNVIVRCSHDSSDISLLTCSVRFRLETSICSSTSFHSTCRNAINDPRHPSSSPSIILPVYCSRALSTRPIFLQSML